MTEYYPECTRTSPSMHMAARMGDVSTIKFLISRGFLVNCMEWDLSTPLHNACAVGQLKTVEFLISQGAWIDAPNIDRSTPLCEAAAGGHTECVALLLQHKARVNPSMVSTSPLHEAAIRGYCNSVRLLLEHGASVHASDCHVGTPLHAACAAYRLNLTSVLLILKAGADVNATMIHKTPLHIAVKRQAFDLVRLLLIYGASVYLTDNQNRKAIEYADSQSEIFALLQGYEKEPLSLLELCRAILIRHNRTNNFESLELPPTLTEYLKVTQA